MSKASDTPPRLSPKDINVLQQLVVRDKYGIELVTDSQGELSRSSIYVLLGRMEDKGLIEGRDEDAPPGAQGPPRRVYKITGVGQRALSAHEAMFAKWRLA